MFHVVGDINWLAVALSTVALTALGGVWFAALFAKPYAQALGRDPEQPPEMTTVSYVGPLVCGLFTVVASAILVEVMEHHLGWRCVRVRLRRWNRIPGGETGVRFAASWEEE